MGYIEIICNDCRHDVGYGKIINAGDCKTECPNCGSDDLNEFYCSDD